MTSHDAFDGSRDRRISADATELARALVRETCARLAEDRELQLPLMIAILDHLPELPSVDAMAAAVGVENRFALARELKKRKLPTFLSLRGRVWALFCLARHHVVGHSLDQQALADGREPSGYYGRIRDLTGMRWSVFRERRVSGGYRALSEATEEEGEVA